MKIPSEPSPAELEAYETLIPAAFGALNGMIAAMERNKPSARDDLLGCVARGCTVRIAVDSTPEIVRISLIVIAQDGSTLTPYVWEGARVQDNELN